MKLELLDGCTFLITTGGGVKIIIDPYMHNYVPDGPAPPGPEQSRPPVGEYADIVTMSHNHFNYSYAYTVKGVPLLYTGGKPAEIKGVHFSSVAGWHYNGPQGFVSLIGIEADGVRVRHMADYGQAELTAEQIEQMGRVDILLTRWLEWTPKLLEQLKPSVVIPMHAEQPDAFMRSLKGFKQLDGSVIEYSSATLPKEQQCILLKPSRVAS
jgi:L-ascorbate metabolism protein UlaG (beta-lactamase superfamily)